MPTEKYIKEELSKCHGAGTYWCCGVGSTRRCAACLQACEVLEPRPVMCHCNHNGCCEKKPLDVAYREMIEEREDAPSEVENHLIDKLITALKNLKVSRNFPGCIPNDYDAALSDAIETIKKYSNPSQ